MLGLAALIIFGGLLETKNFYFLSVFAYTLLHTRFPKKRVGIPALLTCFVK